MTLSHGLKKLMSQSEKKTIDAEYYSWFFYKVLGPMATKCSNYRLRQKNKKANKANKSMQPTAKASAD